MTPGFAVFVGAVALLFNIISLWIVMRLRDDQQALARRVWERLYYLEMGRHSFMEPHLWEDQEMEENLVGPNYRQDGNVIYLEQEE